MRDRNISILGTRNGWHGRELYGLSQVDRRRHLYVVGKTGVGKTTLLRNLLVQDIEAGRGCAIIDPHGDLARELLEHIPSWRINDLVFFNPADREYPVGFNVLKDVANDFQPLVASGVVATFKHLWPSSWGPRLEYILYNAVAALLECRGATLLGIPRLLVDDTYRAQVVDRVQDLTIRSFWLDEFGRWDKRFRADAIAPVQNKVGQFLSSPALRNILGQVKSTIDIRHVMDNKQIFIASLAKGEIGEEPSNLLGSLLVTHFQLSALSRAEMPEDERDDFQLYIDEVHNFTTDTFTSMLSEARKYGLCLTLAHQYGGQLQEPVRQAIMGNVGSMIAFRLGVDDAQVLGQELECSAESLMELYLYETRSRIVRDGQTLEPFFSRSEASWGGGYNGGENMIAQSRRRFGRRRATVEAKINHWLSKGRVR